MCQQVKQFPHIHLMRYAIVCGAIKVIFFFVFYIAENDTAFTDAIQSYGAHEMMCFMLPVHVNKLKNELGVRHSSYIKRRSQSSLSSDSPRKTSQCRPHSLTDL